MKKKLGFMLAAFALVSVMASGIASAAYNSNQDSSVNVSIFPNSLQPSSSLGQATFQLQEGLQNTITNSTGVSVDHSYIWINVNGASLLAVDPPVAMF